MRNSMTATNTPDKCTFVPQTRPEDLVDVQTSEEVTYWHRSSFVTEGPYSEATMSRARTAFPAKYVDLGWWERRIEHRVVVTEQLYTEPTGSVPSPSSPTEPEREPT